MQLDLENRLNVIKPLIIEAGNAVLKIKAEGFSERRKPDQGIAPDYVTDADEAADKFLREKLAELFPGEQIITEETFNYANPPEIAKESATWIVDPLDGTHSFRSGKPDYVIMVGLIIKTRPVLGIVYAPEHGVLYYGLANHGSYKEMRSMQQKLQVSTVGSRSKMTMPVSDVVRYNSEAINAALGVKILCRGSNGIKAGLLAEGTSDFFYAHAGLGIWDVVPIAPIIEEAGGRATNLLGMPIDFTRDFILRKGYLASNGLAHQELLDIIRPLAHIE